MAYKVDPWYKSKRIIASAVIVLSMVATFMGYSITEGDQEIVTDSLLAISSAVAAILVTWSKIRESSKVKEDETEPKPEIEKEE